MQHDRVEDPLSQSWRPVCGGKSRTHNCVLAHLDMQIAELKDSIPVECAQCIFTGRKFCQQLLLERVACFKLLTSVLVRFNCPPEITLHILQSAQ
jgi:hypothetical protein